MIIDKGLLVYYSYTGNIESLIPIFTKNIELDVIRVYSEIPYPTNSDEFWKRCKNELDNETKPRINKVDIDFSKYKVILIVTPNWCNMLPPPLRTFLSTNRIEDKKIIPVISYDRSVETEMYTEIEQYTKNNELTSSLIFQERNLTSEKLTNFIKEIQ